MVSNGFNPVQAVVDLGITENRNSAHVIGYRLLQNVTVKKMIEDHLNDAELTADRTAKEISKVAYSQVDSADGNTQLSAKMKALDLATKVLGMQSTKVESVDLTEKSATESALLKSIDLAAKRDDCTPESAAIQLFQALSDDPQLSQVEAWPQRYREIIQQSQRIEQVTEIQGEQ